VPVPGKRSALYYLNEVILGMGPLVPMTPAAHYGLCLFAEGATGIPEIDSARVKLIQVARGFGKSALITKGLPLQHLLRGAIDPAYADWACGIANEKQDLAEGFLAMIKLEFETNSMLRALFPELIPKDFRKTTWASDRIVVNRAKPRPTSPSVLATGTTATVTGVHMNEWICDDLISQNAAENARRGLFTEIEATNRWLNRLEALLCNPKRDPITVIGTPWWEGDTYDYMEQLWGHGEPRQEFAWTLHLPTGEVQTIALYRVGELAIFRRPAIEHGTSIFPERWTIEELQMLSQQDPVFFAANYLLEPTAGGASDFSPEWLRYYELDGAQIRYRTQEGKLAYTSHRELTNFISVDLAISDSHDAARSVVATCGTNGSEVFLLDDWAEQGVGMFDLASRVVDSFARYRPRYVFLETIAYQRAFKEALEQAARDRMVPEIMGAVQEIRSHAGKSKDFRIYGLEPFFKRGLVHVHRTHQNFLREYSGFPRTKWRDVLDAISFQKDAWERAAQTGSQGAGDLKARDRAAMERMRAALGRGGGY
jgi:hypothetical protein